MSNLQQHEDRVSILEQIIEYVHGKPLAVLAKQAEAKKKAEAAKKDEQAKAEAAKKADAEAAADAEEAKKDESTT